MNLAFYITPVAEVVSVEADGTVRQALHRMRKHRYSAVPILDREGCYVGTLTEGDLLYALLDGQIDPERVRVRELERHVDNRAVSIVTDLRDVLDHAADQNFVPVIDSRGVLMGIVTRRVILAEWAGKLAEGRTSVDGRRPSED